MVGIAGSNLRLSPCEVRRKGPDEQSKWRNDCTLDTGIGNVRKMELIRDGDFLNADDLRDHRSIFPLKIR